MKNAIEPDYPFEGYDGPENAEYVQMMPFIVRIESFQSYLLGLWGVEHLAPESVIDFGCGPGNYLLPYRAAGARILGLDACSEAGKLLTPSEFRRTDLRFPLDLQLGASEKYDLAMFFEVAEHMDGIYADHLVDTVCQSAHTIMFTGATPGQGGSYHKNEQPHSYWLDKFHQRQGYTLHPLNGAMHDFLETLRPNQDRNEVCGWLLNNSFLLHKTT